MSRCDRCGGDTAPRHEDESMCFACEVEILTKREATLTRERDEARVERDRLGAALNGEVRSYMESSGRDELRKAHERESEARTEAARLRAALKDVERRFVAMEMAGLAALVRSALAVTSSEAWLAEQLAAQRDATLEEAATLFDDPLDYLAKATAVRVRALKRGA